MAQRDMTPAEFRAALRRNGFAPAPLGGYRDTTGQVPTVNFGHVFNPNTGKTLRRSTIAHLIRSREAFAARERA